MSSATVLDRVVRSASHAFTATTEAEIAAKVRVYAPNASFRASRDILEQQHILIVSGPPGVGKTTLAEMLSYAYVVEDWDLVALRSLDDGFAAIHDDKKQLFLFDDFLGKVALDTHALASKDSDLARFMKRVRTAKNARFILTTRAYIFEEARRASEHLSDRNVDISKYVLDVGVYTRRVKARILYNHLALANVPQPHIDALINSNKISAIVDHKNYNPRIIESMTDAFGVSAIPPSDYPDYFLSVLANPKQLWDTAYRTHIPAKCQHLLIAMFFCNQYSTSMDELRKSYEATHLFLGEEYNLPRHIKDFEESLKILEGGFIGIQGETVTFINPSLRDYLTDYLSDIALLSNLARVAVRGDWAEAVWRHAMRLKPSLDAKRALAASFKDVAAKFAKLPTLKKYGEQSWVVTDSSFMSRLNLLIELGECADSEYYNTLALDLAQSAEFSSWRDGSEIVELLGKFLDGGYFEESDFTRQMVATLQARVVEMLAWGTASDDLEKLSDAIDDLGNLVPVEVQSALNLAISQEIGSVEEVISNMDSEATLEEHLATIEKLASRASIPDYALIQAREKIEERIIYLENITTTAPSPSFSKSPFEDDEFSDVELRNLFATLASLK